MQAHTKQRRLDSHVVVIVLADATVEALEGEAPWTAALLKNMGVKLIESLVVRKGANPNPKGKRRTWSSRLGYCGPPNDRLVNYFSGIYCVCIEAISNTLENAHIVFFSVLQSFLK